MGKYTECCVIEANKTGIVAINTYTIRYFIWNKHAFVFWKCYFLTFISIFKHFGIIEWGGLVSDIILEV